MKTPKFKVGDLLRCKKIRIKNDYAGEGYEEGLIIKVEEVVVYSDVVVYFPGKNGDGVFERFLEYDKINNWRQVICQKEKN